MDKTTKKILIELDTNTHQIIKNISKTEKRAFSRQVEMILIDYVNTLNTGE